MSKVSKLIKEIRDRLNELESLLNPSQLGEIPPPVIDISRNNFLISDSCISLNATDFQISKPKLIEFCNLIVNQAGSEINIKPYVETFDPNRCNSYCIVKEIPRREKFLKEDENLYYDLSSNKYYSQCRMPKDKGKSNHCARHTGIKQTDVSKMKILTDSKYILLLDPSIKEYCKMYLSRTSPIHSPNSAPSLTTLTTLTTLTALTALTAPATQKSSVLKKAPAPKPKEPLSSEPKEPKSSESESEETEVDMIVSKVIETLKPVPAPAPAHSVLESESESSSDSGEDPEDPEDSDDCMLDADEIHDEDGKIYYIDESKSVIELDENNYGVKIGILKELKSGSIFYKNKRWKIDYFPTK